MHVVTHVPGCILVSTVSQKCEYDARVKSAHLSVSKTAYFRGASLVFVTGWIKHCLVMVLSFLNDPLANRVSHAAFNFSKDICVVHVFKPGSSVYHHTVGNLREQWVGKKQADHLNAVHV